jgi:hypothetical protein
LEVVPSDSPWNLSVTIGQVGVGDANACSHVNNRSKANDTILR